MQDEIVDLTRDFTNMLQDSNIWVCNVGDGQLCTPYDQQLCPVHITYIRMIVGVS